MRIQQITEVMNLTIPTPCIYGCDYGRMPLPTSLSPKANGKVQSWSGSCIGFCYVSRARPRRWFPRSSL